MMLSEAAKIFNVPSPGKDVLFKGCSTDSREDLENKLFIALKGENFDGHDFISDVEVSGASALMLERQIESKLPHIIVNNTKRAMGTLASTWRKKFSAPVIGITGSNGKTTVKEMLTEILKQHSNVLSTQGNLNNDIGMPLTLFGLGSEHDYVVLEMGANHPGEIDYLTQLAEPNVAVITQCAPAHLEGFGSIEGVASAKAEIYNGLDKNGTAVINGDDDFAEYWKVKTGDKKQIIFGIEKAADVKALKIKQSGKKNGFEFELQHKQESVIVCLNVIGKHNIMNALAATACAIALNIDLTTIRDGLNVFSGVKGRLQVKTAFNGATIIDDSYNANPTSLAAAISHLVSLGDDTWLVMGEMGELGEDAVNLHKQAGENARRLGIKNLLTFGELTEITAASFGAGGKYYSDKQQLIKDLIDGTSESSKILVKGSRAMKMEDIVDAMINQGIPSC